MRKFLITYCLLIISTMTSAREHIMISAFDPFGSNTTNNSWDVALEIKKLSKEDKNVDLSLCLLPTVYDSASEILQDCIHAQDEEITKVISLGESSCKLSYETVAHNQDSSLINDNNGESRINSKIVDDGERVLGMTLPVHKMYCSQSNEVNVQEQVKISDSAGRYVCNNTAYKMLYNLDKSVPYSFIHVPNSKCTTSLKDPKYIAKIIWTSIKTIIDSNLPKTSENGELGIGKNIKEMPASFSEANQAIKFLKRNGKSKCEINFFKKLRFRLII